MKQAEGRSWLRTLGGRTATWIFAFTIASSLILNAAPAQASGLGDGWDGATGNPAVASDLMNAPWMLSQGGMLSLLPDQQLTGAGMPLQWTGVPWPDGLHVSGLVSENAGMWVNPFGLKDWTGSRQSLAFLRTLGQVDLNYDPDEDNSFFLRSWFVYEPPYGWARKALGPQAGSQSTKGNNFYNQYTIRDAWWRGRFGPLTLYVGNQVVVWGQSISFRVGDVINPTDTTWGFGFANLEQARMPQWMIHPTLNLPNWGPFGSNFIEAVLIPGFEPMWTNIDYYDGRYVGDSTVAGRVINGATSGISHGGGRFDIHFDNQPYPGRDVVVAPGSHLGGIGLVAPPFSRTFYDCNIFGGLFAPAPGALNPPNPVKARSCPAVTAAVLSGQSPVQTQPFSIPPVTWSNMQWGFRLHTITPDGTELTALYYNTFDPGAAAVWVPYTPIWKWEFPWIQDVGITADRPVPLPSEWAERLPLVARFESAYTNHVPYQDMDPLNIYGVRYSDVLQDMFAIDLDQAYAPWLTTTGNLTANVEFLDYITLDANHNMCEAEPTGGAVGGVGCDVNANVNKHDDFILLNLATSWWWNTFAPAWTMIYALKGNTFLLFPSLTITPPWTTKYFFRLQDVQVLSSDRTSFDGGTFKGENYVGVLFQYNFNLL